MAGQARGGADVGSPAYHAGDHVLVVGRRPGVVQCVERLASGAWLYHVETAEALVECSAGALTSASDLPPAEMIDMTVPHDTPERYEVRGLMCGTRDIQGLPGIKAVLTVIARDRNPDPETLLRRSLELLAYAWGFAHGMHTTDLPPNPGICGPHADVMREGLSDGLRVVPWEMNPAPLPTASEGS